MLRARDYRERAFRALNGKWGTVAITCFLVTVVSSACGSLIGLGSIVLLIFQGPIAYGLAVQALNVVRGKHVEVSDVMAAQNRFADAVVAYLINCVYTFLWTLLFIIPGIIAAYSYSMTFYLLADNPQMTPDAARRESMRLMEGNKWKLFCLHMSFIGWFLLCAVTFGILSFWVIPYMQSAVAEFYDCLIPTRPTVEDMGDTRGENAHPFDLNNATQAEKAQGAHGNKNTDEPFYVFEEEIPRDAPDNPDSSISGKR